MSDLCIFLRNLKIRWGERDRLFVDQQGLARKDACGLRGAFVDANQTAIGGRATLLANRLGDKFRGGVWGGVHHLGFRFLMLTPTGVAH